MDRDIQNYLAYSQGQRLPSSSNLSKYYGAQPKTVSKGNPLLKAGTSIVGGTLGAVLGSLVAPGAGTFAGGAIGSGLGTALGRALGGQSVLGEGGLGEIAVDTTLGGLFSGAGKAYKAAQAGKAVAGMAGKELATQTAKGLGESAGVSVGKGAAEKALKSADKITGQQALESAQKAVIEGRPKDIFGKAALSTQRAAQKELGFQEGAKIGQKVLNTKETDNLFNFLINKIGIKGGEKLSPGLAMRRTESFTDDIFKNLQKSAQDVKYVFSKTDAQKLLTNAREAYPVTVRQNSKVLKELESNILNKITNKEFVGVDNVRKEVQNAINFSSKQGAKEPWLEQAAKSLRNAIDDRLVEISPVNKEIKGLYSNAADINKLLNVAQQIEKQGPSNFFQAGLRGAQASRAAIGTSPLIQKSLQRASAINTIGGRLGAGIPTVLSQTGRQTARGAVSPIAQQMFTQPPQEQGMQDITGATDNQITNDMVASGQLPGSQAEMYGQGSMGASGTMGDMGQQSQIDSYFQGLAMQDLQQTGGKRLAAIKAAYDLFGGGKSQKSVTQQNAERKLQQASNTVNLLQQTYQQAGGAQGFGGYVAGAAGTVPGLNPQAKAYNDLRGGALAQISKALGESGVLTDQDIKRALNLVPGLEDSPQSAAIKWSALKQLLSTTSAELVGSDTRFAQ